jgi:hypothetical protein
MTGLFRTTWFCLLVVLLVDLCASVEINGTYYCYEVHDDQRRIMTPNVDFYVDTANSPFSNLDDLRINIQKAADEWNSVLKFKPFGTLHMEVPADENAHNVISFANLGGTRGSLAITSLAVDYASSDTCPVCGGAMWDMLVVTKWRIVFNTYYKFGDAEKQGNVCDFRSVLLHEFGHTLGLAHVQGCGEQSIMTLAPLHRGDMQRLEPGDLYATQTVLKYGAPDGVKPVELWETVERDSSSSSISSTLFFVIIPLCFL